MLRPTMRLPRRVQVLVASMLAIIVLALGLDLTVLEIRERAGDERAATLSPARVEVQALLASLRQQESGQRGFLLTGEDDFLDVYTEGIDDAETHLSALRTMLADHDDLLAALDRVESRINAWQDLGADFEITARQQGREDVVTSLVAGGTSARLFADVRTEIADLETRLNAANNRERADVDRLDDILLAIDVGTLLVAVVLLGIGALLARLWFTRPLLNLTRSVQEVASGALRSTVTVQGPPEFVELAADVDAMRRRILAEVEEAERAREALADRGMVVLTLRDELAATPSPSLPPGVGLAARFVPAQGIVAGDWFDVVRLPDDRVAVALVDVSGHGAGVGAFALRTKALTLAAIQSHEPGDAFSWVAERLGDTGEQFLTGVILVLDPATGDVTYASAGHPPLLLAGLTGVTQLGPTGPLLGPLMRGWETASIELARGGVLVAYSDGLIEARDDRGEAFGVSRVAELVERAQLGGPDAVADACLDAVRAHQAMREDDLTLVVLSR